LDRGGDREEGGAQMTGDDDALAMVVEASTEMSDAPPAGRGSLFDAMSPAMLAAAIARRLLGPRPVVDWPQAGLLDDPTCVGRTGSAGVYLCRANAA
jgi:hypothetical protein